MFCDNKPVIECVRVLEFLQLRVISTPHSNHTSQTSDVHTTELLKLPPKLVFYQATWLYLSKGQIKRTEDSNFPNNSLILHYIHIDDNKMIYQISLIQTRRSERQLAMKLEFKAIPIIAEFIRTAFLKHIFCYICFTLRNPSQYFFILLR